MDLRLNIYNNFIYIHYVNNNYFFELAPDKNSIGIKLCVIQLRNSRPTFLKLGTIVNFHVLQMRPEIEARTFLRKK